MDLVSVSVIIFRTGREKKVRVRRGTTIREVLEQVGLNPAAVVVQVGEKVVSENSRILSDATLIVYPVYPGADECSADTVEKRHTLKQE